MNIKRAIGIIFLVCIAASIACIIEAKLIGVDLETTDPSNIPLAMWYVAIISVVLLVAAGTAWFFNSPETVPNAKNGFLFGLLAIVIGFFGDIIALVPHKNGLGILLEYYSQPKYWAAFILILMTCALVGYVKSKKKRLNAKNSWQKNE